MVSPLARVDEEVYKLYKNWKKRGKVRSFPEFTRALVRERTIKIDEKEIWGFFK